MVENVNRYLVKISEVENAKLFGIARRSKVYVSLSSELMKSIVELSNARVYPIECINEIVLKSEVFYDKALRELENAIKNAVVKKLESESEFKEEREMTIERKEVSLMDYILELEEAKKEEQQEKMRIAIRDKMIEFAEKHNLGYEHYYSFFELRIHVHKYTKELRFNYTEEDLRRLQSINIDKEVIQFQNEIIANLESEVSKLKNEIKELKAKLESDENDE